MRIRVVLPVLLTSAMGTSLASAASVPGPANTLRALKVVPLDRLPAVVSRGPNAEHGTLAFTLSAPLADVKGLVTVRSDRTGRIGRVTKVGNRLVFRFDQVSYTVAPFRVRDVSFPAQDLVLDPSRPNTIVVDLTTGRITRAFHWLLRSSAATYNGQHTLPFEDHGQSGVAQVVKLGTNRYEFHLVALWKGRLKLRTWSVRGRSLPPVLVTAHATFDLRDLLTFGVK